MNTRPQSAKTLPQAIATMEGYYITTPPSRARRNNNPGNIEWGTFAKAHNASHIEPNGVSYQGRFAVFLSATDGWAALSALLMSPTYADLSIESAILRYAPPTENNSNNYVQQVCRWCGCKPTDTVREVMG